MKKLTVTKEMIFNIKELAQNAYRAERDLSRFDTKELQVYLILRGLESLLISKGLEPVFEIKIPEIGDSEPVSLD